MAIRLVFILVFVALLISKTVYADEEQNLPSRNADVVIPLLEKFSPQGKSRQDILDQLGTILGKPDGQLMHSLSTEDRSAYYVLENKSKINVSFSGSELASIALWTQDTPSKFQRFLYRNPKFLGMHEKLKKQVDQEAYGLALIKLHAQPIEVD